MAEYDPTAAMDFGAADDSLQNGDYQHDQQDAGEDDDDYDPSSYDFGADAADSELQVAEIKLPEDHTTTAATEAANEQPAKLKTVGGFVLDDDDEEEQEDMAPPPSQLNGTEGAQSGLGAVAVSEAQDVPVASEPQDTAAVSPAQTSGLHGSAPVVVPPVSNTSSTSSATVSAPSLQSPDQGKQAASLSATASARQSATPQPPTATPQPPIATPQPAVAVFPESLTNGLIPQTPTTQRLPHDKVGQLEDRIKDDPKADTEAWKTLIHHYREKGQIDSVRKVYGRFLEVFPTAASLWIEYAQLEIDEDNQPKLQEILLHSLQVMQVLNVDLWNIYVEYLRRIHSLLNDTNGTNRGIISSAFDAVLEYVGIDPDAGKLWREYIDFVKTGPGNIAGTGWQDAQKVDLLRKAYQRAIKVPSGELTKLWKEYDNFELQINKTNGRKHLQEQSPHYMTARTARTQLEQRTAGLERSSLPVLPPLEGCKGDDEFADQVAKWREWIAWEKEDPLVLKDEDVEAYPKRVLYVYKQATMQLRFYPEMWFNAATWCFEQGTASMIKDGEDFLDNGITACPESVLLALKKLERMEGSLESGNTDEVAIRNGERLDAVFEGVHKPLYALHKKMQERTKKSVQQIQEYFNSLPPEDEMDVQIEEDGKDDEDSPTEKLKDRAQQMQDQIEAVRATDSSHQEALKRTISYIWVEKMRAFRRVQGQGNPNKPKKGFRGVFGEARPRGQLTSEVYIASALMEFQCYKEKETAKKIFERGLKLFPFDEVFALAYIKYLGNINDDTNARAVFETTMTKICGTTTAPSTLSYEKQQEKARPLLAYMHSFESNYGDLDKIHRIERRMKDMYPLESEVDRFGNRYALPSVDAMQIQLVISPTQAQPKPVDYQPTMASRYAMPSIEEPRSPVMGDGGLRLGPNGPYVGSPKRALALDDSDSEAPQRKFRKGGESPLKGAAGRRTQNHSGDKSGSMMGGGGGGAGFMTKNYMPPSAVPAPVGPAPLPRDVVYLLSIIPPANQYRSTVFDAGKMLELLRNVNLQSAGLRAG